jgi:hypothetical protein
MMTLEPLLATIANMLGGIAQLAAQGTQNYRDIEIQMRLKLEVERS